MERYDCQNTGEIINIGVGKDQKIRELADRVKGIIGYDGAVEYDDSKPDGTPRKLLDVTRLRNLGWSPKISIEEGIKNTYNGYCDVSLKHED
jgi:GDP-L-fucose synthase